MSDNICESCEKDLRCALQDRTNPKSVLSCILWQQKEIKDENINEKLEQTN